MTYRPLPSKAGVNKDDSPLEAQLTWEDADKIRFVGGLPETIYGWERATSSQLLGICRGAFTYADNQRNPIAAFGTHRRLYAMNLDGMVFDITPVVERGVLANPFSTTSGSAVVSVADTAHGRVALDKVTFVGASAVGGITVSGDYTVTEVIDANCYTITHSAAASSTAGPGGGAVLYDYALGIGQEDGLGGLGYGTGGYGAGGRSGQASDGFDGRDGACGEGAGWSWR